MTIQFDHSEPVIPDTNPNRPPPPAPAPDVVPVRDPLRPEHPDPVKEPPMERHPQEMSSPFPPPGVKQSGKATFACEPPISAWARRESRERVRAAAALSTRGKGRPADPARLESALKG